MDIKEKLETYLIELSIPFENKGENLWTITDNSKGFENVVITLNESVITIGVNVMLVPSAKKEEFYETLLKLNATDMIHGAYGINGNNVVLVDSLEGDTMDHVELEASLDAISLALSQHYPVLSKYRK